MATALASREKTVDSNGTQLTNFDVPDWNWETDPHEFSLVINQVDYSWFSGDILLGAGTLEEAGSNGIYANSIWS